MKVLFAGTPDFAVAPLTALITAQHDIVGVFTQPDRKAGRGKKLTPPPVKLAAEKYDLPVFQPESLQNQTALIRELSCDVMVVVAYGVLLPQEILDIPPVGCLNIHASILPRWRGAAPIQRAIEAGDTQTGVSIMRMEAGLDTGPVYNILSTSIETTDNSQSLHNKLSTLGAEGICDTLERLSENPSLKAQNQDHEQACYAKKISKADANIDWARTAQEIDQQIRAFNPWPICQTYHKKNRVRIWQASVIDTLDNQQTINSTAAVISEKIKKSYANGEIIRAENNDVDVQTSNGILRLEICQRDGSKPMPISEFGNGYPLKAGDLLGPDLAID